MFRWLKSIFCWHEVRASQSWHYMENSLTGQRKAIWSGVNGGYQPLDRRWLRTGDIIVGPYGRALLDYKSEDVAPAYGADAGGIPE